MPCHIQDNKAYNNARFRSLRPATPFHRTLVAIRRATMHSTARTLGRRIIASAPRALVAVEAPGAAAGGGALTRGFARGYAASSCAA